MTLRLCLLVLVGAVMLGLAASDGYAHHGPPHEEIDEFDDPAGGFASPERTMGLSWPALMLSVGGAAVAFALSRASEVEGIERCPVGSRR